MCQKRTELVLVSTYATGEYKYTLKGYILCYGSFVSIKLLLNKHGHPGSTHGNSRGL